MKTTPVLPTSEYSPFAVAEVEHHLPDTWLHIYGVGGHWTEGEYIDHRTKVELCPHGKCESNLCQRAGDWLLAYEDNERRLKALGYRSMEEIAKGLLRW